MTASIQRFLVQHLHFKWMKPFPNDFRGATKTFLKLPIGED